ncbi:hypothetical protein H6F51_24695 [Cyanobacteria bacterium FACHB-DQ100]|nr:hypothetical protein [Cyanobacteria bacterium FACHB-DQ100]
MSQLSKHSEAHIIWTIGNTQIVESEPDQGFIPTMKAAFLGIAAITAAPVSPVIAIALAGYAAIKVFESFNLSGREAREVISNLYDDVNGVETPNYQAHLPEREPVRITTQLGEQSAIDVQVQADSVALLNRSYQTVDQAGLPEDLMSLAIQKPYNTLIFGQSEAGKDITLYNLMKRNRSAHNAYFLGIDGKNHPNERALWSREIYDKTLHFSMLDHPESYHSGLLAALKLAVQQPMSFIAFSEINGVRAAYINAGMKAEWQNIAHYISYFAIQGNANRHFLYGTVQALSLEELGLGSGDRGNIYFLAIANSTQFAFIESVGASVKVFPKALTNQAVFQSAVSRSTATQHLKNHSILKGIAYFHTAIGEWRPMPRLDNPGSDRGEGLTAANPTSQAPIVTPAIAPEVTQSNQANKEDKSNIQKPSLSRTELVLAIAELGEWIDKNSGLSFSQQYANYNAARKGFSRPQFRYLLTQIEILDSE